MTFLEAFYLGSIYSRQPIQPLTDSKLRLFNHYLRFGNGSTLQELSQEN